MLPADHMSKSLMSAVFDSAEIGVPERAAEAHRVTHGSIHEALHYVPDGR